jgi:hypothetical protein
MKIGKLLASPPVKTTHDLYDMERHMGIEMWDFPDDAKNTEVEMRYYVDECFDGERGFEIVSIWFKGQAVMLSTRGGRGLSDTEDQAIIDDALYNAMHRYLDSLKKEDLEHLAIVDLDSNYDDLNFEYAQNTLHTFYNPEGVNPKYKVGDVVIAKVPENHLQFGSPAIETRVEIIEVRKYNPINTYSGVQLDRRWGDGKLAREMITDVGNGGIGAHFPEKHVVGMAGKSAVSET